MADENGRWVTVNGAHVFIKDGETPSFGKKLQKTVKPENRHTDDEDEKLKIAYTVSNESWENDRIKYLKNAMNMNEVSKNGKLMFKLHKELQDEELNQATRKANASKYIDLKRKVDQLRGLVKSTKNPESRADKQKKLDKMERELKELAKTF